MLCIDPLNTAGNCSHKHSFWMYCQDEVNVHDAVDLGKALMEWSEGFHQPLKESSHNERVQEENKDRYCRTI